MQYNDIFNYKSIVFRGKNILNNDWVYGYFKQDNNKMYIEIDADNIIEIIPSTLGVFTGLLDFTNNRIFTGDVIHNMKYQHKHLIIQFNGTFSAVSISDYEYVNSYLSDLSYEISGKLTYEWIQQCEKIILGNVYDNPDIFVSDLIQGK